MIIKLSGERHINYHASSSSSFRGGLRENGKDPESVGACITSNLKEEDPETDEDNQWNDAIDVLESLVLAHVSEGLDVQSQAYVNGLETVLNKLEQQIYD